MERAGSALRDPHGEDDVVALEEPVGVLEAREADRILEGEAGTVLADDLEDAPVPEIPRDAEHRAVALAHGVVAVEVREAGVRIARELQEEFAVGDDIADGEIVAGALVAADRQLRLAAGQVEIASCVGSKTIRRPRPRS